MTAKTYAPGTLERCAETEKAVHPSQLDRCGASNVRVLRSLLRESNISGRKAQARYFGSCAFTGIDGLVSELATSEISGKRYRSDESAVSAISGKTGHRSEFIACHETEVLLARSEAETCEISGRHFRLGLLERCSVTAKLAHPSQLERCAVTKRKALRSRLVSSSVSGRRLLEQEAFPSIAGNYCLPNEAVECAWSGGRYHPDDIQVCELTGVNHHVQFAAGAPAKRLRAMAALLEGSSYRADGSPLWERVAAKAKSLIGRGTCVVEAAELSPDGRQLAVTVQVKKYLGLSVHHVGFLYSMNDNEVVGRLVVGHRGPKGWIGHR